MKKSFMIDNPKVLEITPEIYNYLVTHGTPPDELQQELIEKTKEVGSLSVMQIAPDQGSFMMILARLIGAKRALELGTFTGYSSLCLARGLSDDGYLLCCDISEEWTAIAQSFWEKAGVSDKIDLRVGPALETLQALPEVRDFDLAFIDADKENQEYYFEEIVKRIRPGGVILVDNVLMNGEVVDTRVDKPHLHAIRKFNQKVAQDSRVECVMLPIADGLTLLRVL